MLEIIKMTAKFFYQENTLVNVIASKRASRYVRTKEVILSDRSGDVFPASLLACELSGTVSGAASQDKLSGFRYAPYGRRSETLSEATQLGFNGEYCLPGLALYLLGNGYRAYNPGTMRFVSPDSISPFHVLNAYSYCSNDPINKADPSGHIEARHLAKLNAKIKSLKSQGSKIRAWANTVDLLGNKTQLSDAQTFTHDAKRGMRDAYIEAAFDGGWLGKKSRNVKYADRKEEIENALSDFHMDYVGLQNLVDARLESNAKVWAENESKINGIAQQDILAVSTDPQQANSDVRANRSPQAAVNIGNNVREGRPRRLVNHI